MRTSLAWAGVPAIAGGIVFWPIQIALFGEDMFRTETPYMDAHNPFFVLGALLVPIVPAFWSVFVGLQAYAEVNQFSAWRSLGSGLLAMLVIVVPLVALVIALAMVL